MSDERIMECLKAGGSVKWDIREINQPIVDLMDKLEAEGFVTLHRS